MAAVFGENMMTTTSKDMELKSFPMVTHTLDSSQRVACMAMEYTDGQVGQYTMDNGKIMKEMVMDCIDLLTKMNMMDNLKILNFGEKDFYLYNPLAN